MVWMSSISRRGPPMAAAVTASASVCAARRPLSSAVPAAAAARSRRSGRAQRPRHGDDQRTTVEFLQRRLLSAANSAPVQGPIGGTAAAAVPTAEAAAATGSSSQPGSAKEGSGKQGTGVGGDRDVGDELWFVGRIMENFDTRLGAKQEKIRIREIGVIERFAAIITTLDGDLKPREGDEFLDWLRSRGSEVGSSSPSQSPPQGRSASVVTEDDEKSAAASSGGADNGDSGGGEVMEGAKKRAEVEDFLSAAAARLNALVDDDEESLFRDRGEVEGQEEGLENKGVPTTATSVPPNMPEEEFYQATLGAHRVMLCHCLSLLLSSLKKEQLKPGLEVGEVAAVVRSLYLAAPEERLGAIFPLFDTHGDGYLDAEGVERAVDATVLPLTVAAERCYLAAARPVLDKKAATVMPSTMKYTLWDVLEVPVKRRCSFAWAEDRKQVGPDDWRVSWDQFAPSRRKNFPEFESVAKNYMAEFSRRRSGWHESRKGRREAMVYGSALLFAVILMDSVLKGV